MVNDVTSWKIRIAGYGTFEFEGTEDGAQEAMRNKSRWEGGSGLYWRADLLRDYDRLTAKIAAAFDDGLGVPMSLIERRNAAKIAANI